MPDGGEDERALSSRSPSPLLTEDEEVSTGWTQANISVGEVSPQQEPDDLDISAKTPAEAPATTAGNNHDAWSCPICLCWFDMPVAPPCRHSFCSACLKKFVRSAGNRRPTNVPTRPACPICREMFSPETVEKNVTVFEDMRKATVVCKNKGCGAQFCPLRWKHHQEECPAASVQCKHHLVGCAWKGRRRGLSAHLESCAYEKIKGLIPRISGSLKKVQGQIHALEARVLAQNTRLANMRAFLVGVHQRERRGSLFPATYALLWRPQDWRRYSCPNSDGVLANVTLICFAPIVFMALWGAGVFHSGSGGSLAQRVASLVGLAILGFFALVEYNNSAPWHVLTHPRLLRGVKIGPLLLESTTMLVVYAAIKPLSPSLQWAASLLFIAPLTFSTVVHGIHRFQVNLNEAQIQARQSLPSRTRVRPSPVKVYRPTINGVIWAYAMLTFGAEAVLVARVSAKVGLCAASSGVGPRVWDELSDRLWANANIGRSPEEKDHIQQMNEINQWSTKAPFPNWTSIRARACMLVVCFFIFGVLVSAYRDCLRTVGFSLIAMHIMNKTYLLWDIWVGRWVMASLEQTSPRLNADAGGTRNALYDLWRSRLLVIWLVFGSASFVLLAMLSSPVLVN